MAFSNDGRWLALGDWRGARLVDLDTRSLMDLPANLNPPGINKMIVSNDSRYLFGWHDQRAAILRWDLMASDQVPAMAYGDGSGIRALVSGQNGNLVTSGGVTGTVTLLDFSKLPIASEQQEGEEYSFKAYGGPIDQIALHPEGRWIAAAGWISTSDKNRAVRLWKLDGRSVDSPFVSSGQDDDQLSPMATSSNGRWIATRVKQTDVELWDTKNSRKSVLLGHEHTVYDIDFGNADRWLVTRSQDQNNTPKGSIARLWNLSENTPPTEFKEISGILATAATTNSDQLAAVFSDRTVRLLDLESPSPAETAYTIGTLEFENQQGRGPMLFSPDGKTLVVVCQTRFPNPAVRIHVWKLDDADVIASHRVLDGQRQYLFSGGLRIDSTSRWLVTAGGYSTNRNSDEDTVTIWDLHAVDPGASQRRIKRKGDVWQAAVSRDCRWLFTSRSGGSTQLWDLANGATPHELRDFGQSAAISPDGKWLAAGGRAHFNTLLFDLEADEPWNTKRVLRGHNAPVWAVDFSDDSRWLVTDSSDGTVRRWCMDTEWLFNYARNSVSRDLTSEERDHYGISN